MTRKYFFSATAFVFVLLLTVFAFAEFYQYTDENGVARFTDDASLIPEDQRPDAKTFESVVSSTHYSPQKVRQDTIAIPDDTGTEVGKIRSTAKELDGLRDDLKRSYNALQKEKKDIGDPPPKKSKSGVKADYIYKVTELNRKIDEYEKRQQAFDVKVKAFNVQIGRK